MNVLGKTTLYVNGFDKENEGETRLSVSVKITSKNAKDEWQTAFLPVALSNSVKENLKLDDTSLKKLYQKEGKYGKDIKQSYNIKLENNNAWLVADKYKDTTTIKLFINDLTIVTDDDKEVKKTSRSRGR